MIFCDICSELFQSRPEINNLLFNKIIKITEELVEDEEISEETLLIFPTYFLACINQITDNLYKKIFFIIIEKSCLHEN